MTTNTRKEQIQDMLTDEPNDPFLRYGLAMEYISDGNDDEAARQLVDLAKVCPDYVPAYHQAGQVLTRLGRPDEAREVLKRGIIAARKEGNQHAAEEMQGFLDGIG
jgi:predicted Zn-dependent protease